MNLATAQTLLKAGKELDIEVSIMEKYSGRGMYGKETVAVIVSSLANLLPVVAVAAVSIKEDDFDGFLENVSNLRSDSMGYDTVVY